MLRNFIEWLNSMTSEEFWMLCAAVLSGFFLAIALVSEAMLAGWYVTGMQRLNAGGPTGQVTVHGMCILSAPLTVSTIRSAPRKRIA